MRKSDFQPSLTELERREVPDAYWATHYWTLEHDTVAQQNPSSPPATTSDAYLPYWATHSWIAENGVIPPTVPPAPPTVPPAPPTPPPPAAYQPYWATHSWNDEHQAAVPPVVVSPPVVPPSPPVVVTPPPVVPPAPPPVVVSPPVVPPPPPPVVVSPPVVPPPAPTLGDRVVSFAQANLGQVVSFPNASGCTALVAAALSSVGAVSQSQLGTAGPISDHYVWGQTVFQQSATAGYGAIGSLGDIRAGDVIQVDNYAESRPDGSWLSASHHTAIVQSVDPSTGQIQVLQQNWNGNPAVTTGTFVPSTMTSGVITVYRPTT